MHEHSPEHGLATHSAPMRAVLETLLLAARSTAPIMLRAELGSEVCQLARRAHDNSPCRDRPFLWVSCPSIADLPWDELSPDRGGTVFFDRVEDLIPPLQKKLVHALDEIALPRGTTRVISSTTSAAFRDDLFFRLSVVELRVPPLRERPEDILPLARRFAAAVSAELGRRAPDLSPEAGAVLLNRRWPGNERELRNVIERALLASPADVLEPAELVPPGLPPTYGGHGAGDDVSLRDLEREHIARVMDRVKSYKVAAAILGIDEATLWRRRQRYALERGAPLAPGRMR